ncbi:MAG: 3-deoxy-D-manno-octulosonic acid transferase, partial [Pseudomonadota bacterium]|nr:3-deoxy-D-manno-octulosonic acid transferase [Pseudomonadota bacterium]
QVYLADTLGELGTWYALAPIVFLGGSLREIGGHNPLEPASAGAAILNGPHVTNFAETFAPLIATGGAVQVADADDLAAAVLRWLASPAPLETARTAARSFATRRQEALSDIVERLCAALDLA